MIDLHSVVAFFHKPKWTERAIKHKIDRVLGENTISCCTLEKYVRLFALSTKETDTPIVPESEADFSLDDRIAIVLPEEPFHSVAELLKRLMMWKSTVDCHLTQPMKWKLQHLKRLPHSVTEFVKMDRGQRAVKLLKHLQSIRHQGSQCTLTLGDSWFY
jgi:hypothetical protein